MVIGAIAEVGETLFAKNVEIFKVNAEAEPPETMKHGKITPIRTGRGRSSLLTAMEAPRIKWK